ncbi:MAG: hypothetical protein E3K36_15580 [Candidatus Brocadia sp.]|nr:hypothetical protein [Candidatus Brocadia sp.]
MKLKWWIISLLGVMFLVGQAGWAKAWGLSIEERMACQRAIEEVYWSHTLWPKENPSPKPQLKEVMSEEELRKKVEKTVKMSRALEVIWKRPVRGYQLQAELQRMAETTRNPDMLRELWQALGNDPHLIAECLARPLLVERQIQEWYDFDERFHGKLKKRVMRELKLHDKVGDMKGMDGEYREVELRKGKSHEGKTAEKKDVLELSEKEWAEEIGRLAGAFGAKGRDAMKLPLRRVAGDRSAQTVDVKGPDVMKLPMRRLSKLQEDEEGFYVVGVLKNGADRVRIAVVEWQKVGFDTWWSEAEEQFTAEIEGENYAYNLPEITTTALVPLAPSNTWSATDAGAPAPTARYWHTAVWTGTEMIVWGGGDRGGRYNPATNTWFATTTTGAPTARSFHTAVWTGMEMIVWGGGDGLNTGGRYNPATNTWSATNTTGAPTARRSHTAVWTGTEMIVWGGWNWDSGDDFNTGGRYNPSTNTWSATNTTGVPTARSFHTAVWTGTEMIVWGGFGSSTGDLNTGGRYDPSTNTWSATNTTGVPTARSFHTAVWTGTEMIVWGGIDTNSYSCVNTGGRYDPSTNTWYTTTTTGAPTVRDEHTAVWTGTVMIVWGGEDYGYYSLNTGGRYDPSTNTWSATNTTGVPTARHSHTAVWTDTEMIVWGGWDSYSGDDFNTGGRYDPDIDSWVATSMGKRSAPTARDSHTAVWIGTEMIVWGGYSSSYPYNLNTGGRYDPALNAWRFTNTTNAPSARYDHTAVWTGTRMIIWGGEDVYGPSITGAHYNPLTNNWVAVTNKTGAPTARYGHTAVWTGTRMIVWGGVGSTGYLNTGGRYDPAVNSWLPTNTTGAPTGRYEHTAVWTGTRMIVWGGSGSSTGYLKTGGRYDPAANSWLPTNPTGAPTARYKHTAVWTGTVMIVWGGHGGTGYLNTGGRYNPAANTWSATNQTGAPTARYGHTAVWTGSVMIVWGGRGSTGYLNTGGRYNPANTWSATTTASAPAARYEHTAVWTGTEMIVWGGYGSTGYLYTGGRYFP